MRASIKLTISALLASAGAYAACTPYDPALGAHPYLCAADEPRCPEDFVCKDIGAGVMGCEAASGAVITDAGSGSQSGFQCADDSVLEGATRNDTVATASVTPVASQRPSITFAGLAICPDADKDTYSVDITTSGDNLVAELIYDEGNGGVPLSLSVLNSGGNAIANGSPNGTKVSVTVPNLPSANSPYFVQVFGPAVGQNNYKLTLKVCTTLPCP